LPVKRALFILLFAVAAPVGAQTLPLVPSAPRPEQPTRYRRMLPIPWFYRGIEVQRPNVGLQGRKNATRDEQVYGNWQELEPREPRPLSEW
jgi:hypothetical protein